MTEYKLPRLPYAYNALEPHISEEQLRVHHEKHHKAYVDKSNELISMVSNNNIGSIAKALSFNLNGHILHSLFWRTLSEKGGGKPKGKISKEINNNFGGFDNFKEKFSKLAAVEGSGWAVMCYCPTTKKLFFQQVEKHNLNLVAHYRILLLLDMWEHAFYIDHRNEKAKYVQAFWNVVNWQVVDKRLRDLI